MDPDRAYLLDMLIAAGRAMAAAEGRLRTDLDNDTDFQAIAYWHLCVLGEAAGRVSEEFREAHRDLRWHQVIGLRNRLIHGYGVIDNDIVWEVIQTGLPRLIRQLEEFGVSRD